MAPRPTRKKGKLQWIENDVARKVTFRKRRTGRDEEEGEWTEHTSPGWRLWLSWWALTTHKRRCGHLPKKSTAVSTTSTTYPSWPRRRRYSTKSTTSGPRLRTYRPIYWLNQFWLLSGVTANRDVMCLCRWSSLKSPWRHTTSPSARAKIFTY